MNVACPRCAFESEFKSVGCPRCHTIYDAAAFDEWHHVVYLQRRLIAWRDGGTLPVAAAQVMLQQTVAKRLELEARLGLPAAAPATNPIMPVTHPRLAVLPPAPSAGSAGGLPPTPTVAAKPTFATPAGAAVGGHATVDGAGGPINLPRTAFAPVPAPASEGNAVAGDGGASAAAGAGREGLGWRQLWLSLLSERAMNGLLGLGALLILASGVVLSTLNPTGLAPLPHLAVVGLTLAMFYGGGAFVRQRLGLRKSGTALLGIAAAFVPLFSWTLGQPELANWPAEGIWLATSALCLPLYAASHLWLRDRTFAVLTPLAGASLLTSALHALGTPPDWTIFALAPLALAYAIIARRLPADRVNLADGLNWAAQALAPLAALALLGVRLAPEAGPSVPARAPSGLVEWVAGGAWWLGVALYALRLRWTGRRRYRYALAYTCPIAALLTYSKLPFASDWSNLACAGLLLGYAAALTRTRLRLADAGTTVPIRRLLADPLIQVMGLLTISSLGATGVPLASSVLAAATAAAGWAVLAIGTRRSAPGYAAVSLLAVALSSLLDGTDAGEPLRRGAWCALALALLAAGYAADRQCRPLAGPAWLGGYLVGTLTVLTALGERPANVVMLVLATAVCAASAWLVRHDRHPAAAGLADRIAGPNASLRPHLRAAFLWLTALLGAASLMAALDDGQPWLAGRDWPLEGPRLLALALLGGLYLGIGRSLVGAERAERAPWYGLGWLVGAAPLLAVGVDPAWRVPALLVAAALFGASARLFRAPCFGYPLVAALGVAYALALTWLPARPDLGQLPWLPAGVAALAVAARLRRTVDHPIGTPPPEAAPAAATGAGTEIRPALARRRFAWPAGLDAYATPFLIGADLAALALLWWGHADGWPLALGWWGAAILVGLMAALLRQPWRLYPALGIAVIAYEQTLAAGWPGLTPAERFAALTPVVWLLWGGATLAVTRTAGSARWRPGLSRLLRRDVGLEPAPGWAMPALARPWAAPPAVIGGLAAVAALGASSLDPRLGLATALGLTAALAWLTWRWRGEAEAFGTLALAGLAAVHALRLAGLPVERQAPSWAAAGLALTLGSIWLARAARLAGGVPWPRPLSALGLVAGLASVLLAVDQAVAAGRGAGAGLAVTLAATGLALLARGSYQRQRPLAYTGVALVLAGWSVELSVLGVAEAQAFSLPVGLALLGMALIEARPGGDRHPKWLLELAALAVIAGTTLWQALGGLGAGEARSLYGGLLLLQALALLGAGAALRWKRLFFGAAGALVLDLGVLLADPIRALNTWYLAAIAGLGLIGLVLVLEQRRQRFPALVERWRARLEHWD